MALGVRVLRGSAVVSLGEIVSNGCSLIRNILLARVLTKADFGVAATLAMSASLLELAARMSIDQLVVQSKHADDASFLGTCHFVQCLLGVGGAFLLLLLSWPLAAWFKLPEALWAFQLLSLLPLARAFSNLDVSRMARDMRFWPSISIEAGTQVLITLLVLPLTWWRNDYSVLLWLMVARALIAMLATH